MSINSNYGDSLKDALNLYKNMNINEKKTESLEKIQVDVSNHINISEDVIKLAKEHWGDLLKKDKILKEQVTGTLNEIIKLNNELYSKRSLITKNEFKEEMEIIKSIRTDMTDAIKSIVEVSKLMESTTWTTISTQATAAITLRYSEYTQKINVINLTIQAMKEDETNRLQILKTSHEIVNTAKLTDLQWYKAISEIDLKNLKNNQQHEMEKLEFKLKKKKEDHNHEINLSKEENESEKNRMNHEENFEKIRSKETIELSKMTNEQIIELNKMRSEANIRLSEIQSKEFIEEHKIDVDSFTKIILGAQSIAAPQGWCTIS